MGLETGGPVSVHTSHCTHILWFLKYAWKPIPNKWWKETIIMKKKKEKSPIWESNLHAEPTCTQRLISVWVQHPIHSPTVTALQIAQGKPFFPRWECFALCNMGQWSQSVSDSQALVIRFKIVNLTLKCRIIVARRLFIWDFYAGLYFLIGSTTLIKF